MKYTAIIYDSIPDYEAGSHFFIVLNGLSEDAFEVIQEICLKREKVVVAKPEQAKEE